MDKAFQLAAYLRNLFGRFALSKRGNVALIFAITLVPMLAATGMVVDYTRAAKARQQIQDSLDATALFLSKNPSVSTMDTATLLATAQTYFNVNFTNTDVVGTTISPSYSATGPSVTVSGTTTVNCVFMGIVGVRTIPVAATATAVWGHQRLRVALVLDNTGSMLQSGKITALKTATTNLLSQLRSAASVNGDVYVSIIPFVKDVNVGTYTSAMDSYIAFDDSSCDPSQSTCDGWWDGTNGSCNLNAGYHRQNSPRSTCLALGSCSITGKTYSNCSTSSGCFVSGTYNSTYTTSATCTAAGTCSSSGYTTQSTCLAVGSCNITSGTYSNCTTTNGCFISNTYTSSYTTSGTCTAAGTCTVAGRTTSSACTTTSCTITGKSPSSTCTSTNGCFINSIYTATYTSSSTCTSHSGTWAKGQWIAGTWTAGVWKAGTWTSTYTWTAKTAGTWSAGTWSAVWTPSAHSTWNGCVTERGGSPFSQGTGTDTGPGTGAGNDQLTTTPTTSDVTTLFPAEDYSACPQTMIGLSYDWTALNTEVTNMVANGSTNQPIGLVWGWQSLVGGGPLTMPAYDPAYQYKQVIIILSDGLNTQDRWYGDGSNTSTAVDQRMYYKSGSTISGTCKNIQDQGIIMYTVQVNTGGDPTSTLLQNCASDSSKFFMLTSANAIITTFQAIGTALSDLRLSN